MTDAAQIPRPALQDRPLSEREYALVQWMLRHGNPEAAFFLPQLDRARVLIWNCPCGCASIRLTVDGLEPPSKTDMQILADFLYGNDRELCGAFLYATGAFLSGLEVYGPAVNAPTHLPDIGQFRSIPKNDEASNA